MDRTLLQLSDAGEKTAVLITGGFHTSGIEDLLRSRQVSFATFTPKVSRELNAGVYEKRMMETVFDFDNGEFSVKRLVMRLPQDTNCWSLAAPLLLGDILGGISSGIDFEHIL